MRTTFYLTRAVRHVASTRIPWEDRYALQGSHSRRESLTCSAFGHWQLPAPTDATLERKPSQRRRQTDGCLCRLGPRQNKRIERTQSALS